MVSLPSNKTAVIAYQMSYAYWFAAFPSLARNLPIQRECAEKYNAGQITRGEYDAVDSMNPNHICNMGLCISGAADIPFVAIGIGILYGMHSNEGTSENNWGLSILIAWSSAYWIVLAAPWFVLEKTKARPAFATRQEYHHGWVVAALPSKPMRPQTQADSGVSCR